MRFGVLVGDYDYIAVGVAADLYTVCVVYLVFACLKGVEAD